MERLGTYARLCIAEFVPPLANWPFVPNQLQIFDFSERKQSSAAAAAMSPSVFGGAADGAVVVTRVGDALQEPFWPEGLGINRGFLHALDCADLAKGLAELARTRRGRGRVDVASAAALISRREALFNVTKQVGGGNRKTELKPEVNKRREVAYRIDPATRYVRLPAGL